ncbi:MAG: hypothetical protein M5R42_05560 [Rhodocyclaceae bacterium]|nr:hypothetical protein [Rhodocyclaceae bacterium]
MTIQRRRADDLSSACCSTLQGNQLTVLRQAPRHRRLGGAAAMIRSFDEQFGVTVLHAWGMTEMSPRPGEHLQGQAPRSSDAERDRIRLNQGFPSSAGEDMKIVDLTPGTNCRATAGPSATCWCKRAVDRFRLLTRARGEQRPARGRLFPPGDVATLDGPTAGVRSPTAPRTSSSRVASVDQLDRPGEHRPPPAVAEAAVIGVAHPKWDERPLLIVVKKAGEDVTRRAVARRRARQGRSPSGGPRRRRLRRHAAAHASASC